MNAMAESIAVIVRYLAFTSDLKAKIEIFSQDQGGTIRFKTFNVSGMPVTILVDKKGVIRHIEEGTGAAKLRYMQDILKKLAEE